MGIKTMNSINDNSQKTRRSFQNNPQFETGRNDTFSGTIARRSIDGILYLRAMLFNDTRIVNYSFHTRKKKVVRNEVGRSWWSTNWSSSSDPPTNKFFILLASHLTWIMGLKLNAKKNNHYTCIYTCISYTYTRTSM